MTTPSSIVFRQMQRSGDRLHDGLAALETLCERVQGHSPAFARLLARGASASFWEFMRLLTAVGNRALSAEFDAQVAPRLRDLADQLARTYEEERAEVFRTRPLMTDRHTGLPAYAEVPAWAYASRTQNYVYDALVDDEGPLSKFFWFGNHRRSPEHPVIGATLERWLRGYPPASAASAARSLRVLDVGTGSCASLVRLTGHFPASAHHYGCDLSPIMLSVGIKRLHDRGVRANLCLADAEDLPYRDEVFDVVGNFGGIDQVPSPAKALAEMFRVVAPGGLCLCRDEQQVGEATSLLKRVLYERITKGHRAPVAELPEDAANVRVESLNELHFVLSFQKP
ncbi:class I SAM-dependent methyltransferase [Sorangium sp. So ce341]|uniref:class I SAM-dependent methyltransferase n=1 Tax=Sorangium sp. So ce341 TaxID=3133302 RepID=UPI003F5F3749